MDQLHVYATALQEHLVLMREQRDHLKEQGELLRYHRLAGVITEIEKVLDNLAPLLKPPSLH
jgi:hypothetical protein